ncbi:MAG: TIGR01459 family HAD-type hydrolase [Bradyrhizobiaceae bacterium]|nr:MAG: TIGR01459 family HAD-type hydrolase [Bradyrhizobiaceae bacterium]
MTLRFVDHLRDLTQEVDVILCDIWGVIHDGVVAFPEACGALQTFRKNGGTVVMLTNSPRPADGVQRQLRRLNVSDETYDAIVSSGDLTRSYVAAHPDQSVYQIGPDHHGPTLRGLNVRDAPLEQADYIVCIGPVNDEVDTPEDYRDLLVQARKRNLTMICANPDIIVERGDRMVYCAGAIAELYRELGGEVIFYGKPHRPAYDRAIALAASKRGQTTAAQRMLAIGDSVRTDLAGAKNIGVDCLFVTRGIHSADFASIQEIDDFTVTRLFGETGAPKALSRGLKW